MNDDADDSSVDERKRRLPAITPRPASIGILTYRRPDGLARCLDAVMVAVGRPMPETWTVSEVLVVDNDPGGSAGPAVSAVAETMAETVPIRYVHEPVAGVATARNRALREAAGDVLVFIDDDEIPGEGWPEGLLTVLDDTGAALVGGPVLTEFTSRPPRWIVSGDFFHRDDPEHRSIQKWLRSGNLAVDLRQIREAGLVFDPRFREGEDSAFTRAARAAGLDLRWSTRGAVTEFVGGDRFSIGWRLRREYLSNRAWTRSSLDLAGARTGRIVVRVRVAAIALVRAAEGSGRFAAALVTGRTGRCVEGLATVAGAAGRVVEIVGYRRS